MNGKTAQNVSLGSNDGDMLDVYADDFSLTLSPYGATLLLGQTQLGVGANRQVPPRRLVVVRMSLEHAKVMVMLVRRSLKAYETDAIGSKIALPAKVLEGLGVSEKDW